MSDAAAQGGAKPSKLPMLLVVGNTVAILAALGALLYTQVLYKRPPITEQQERKRIAEAKDSHGEGLHKAAVPGEIVFEKFTATIKPTEEKVHYLNVGFTLEVRDIGKSARIDEIKPVFKDRLLNQLGKQEFTELNTVQGRYLLRSRIIELVNELAGEPMATNVFFTEFIVQ